MAKRFSETDIWKRQRWFRKLLPEYKLSFFYIKDQCDHAGFWNIDCSDLIDDLGIERFDLSDFIKHCNTEYDKENGSIIKKERVVLINNGYLWITGFIQFQYQGKEGLVNPYAAPVRTALQSLIKYKVLSEAFDKSFVTLTEPFDKSMLRPKDKDKDIYTTTQTVKLLENGKKVQPVVNFKAQGENLFAERATRDGHSANNNG